MTSGPPPIELAIVRNADLEFRELAMFDALASRGLVRPRAFGHRPATPYGLDGVQMPVRLLRSTGEVLQRLPAGGTLRRRAERRLGRDLSACWRLAAAIGPGTQVLSARETFTPTAVQCCDYAAVNPGSRTVVSVFETIPFRYDDDPVLHRIKADVLRRADQFVANSPAAHQALLSEGAPPERVHTVPPAVDTDRFSPGPPDLDVRRSWGASAGDEVVLFTGRLIREKGLVELLLALAPHLGRTEGGSRLLVFQGAGPEEPRLQAAARARGVTPFVRVVPWVGPADMPSVYRSADLVVLPSLPTPYWEEQFGFGLVEAMACGRPIVGTRTGAIPWVLGTAGVVVLPYDTAALGASIQALLDDPARRRRLAAEARRQAQARFSVDSAGLALLEVFRHARAQPGRAAP